MGALFVSSNKDFWRELVKRDLFAGQLRVPIQQFKKELYLRYKVPKREFPETMRELEANGFLKRKRGTIWVERA